MIKKGLYKVMYFTSDVNKDGITDLIELSQAFNFGSSSDKKIKIFIIKSNEINLIEFETVLTCFPILNDLFDINGDGSIDLIYNSNKILNFPFAKNTSKLKQIKNGLGNILNFSYSSFITFNPINNYPFIEVSRFYNLCNKTTYNVQLPLEEQSSISYSFKSGIAYKKWTKKLSPMMQQAT